MNADQTGEVDHTPIGDAEEELRDFVNAIRQQVPEASEQEVRRALDTARSEPAASQTRYWLTERVLEILSGE
jgi:enolase